ncbi:MAG TPA: FAD-binding protein [Candidatus Binatia bacterium]|nr:FAD-binding protein [Candidatus Binatia bacterium]
MLTRRDFLKASAKAGAALTLGSAGCTRPISKPSNVLVNDVHSQLNLTRVQRVVRPQSVEEVAALIQAARGEGRAVSIAGGMHAMGGQQFGADTILIDTRSMNRVLRFDAEKGHVEVEAGIQWPELIDYLIKAQQGRPTQWGIKQKQTGADRLCIGGALAANIHSRGIHLKPIINDVESFLLVDANGNTQTCSRDQNFELFRLAIGGYGLFGAIVSVTLRLAPRRKLERVVEIIDVDDLIPVFQERISDGSLYGDFQYMSDPASAGFLRRGIFSRYRPASGDPPVPEIQKELNADDWRRLIYLAHVDKRRVFEEYSSYYRATSGQLYWSDTHQLSTYIDNYHAELDRQIGSTDRASEMISEVYVPRNELAPWLDEIRRDCRQEKIDVIFGVFRLIEKDDETFLAWAKEPYACIIFNLHVIHSQTGLEKAARDFRLLIDRAIQHGGSYYLTYHRWATRKQVESCYPQFPEFLRLKRKYDPEERFQSDWYRHYRAMFGA